MLSEYVIRHLVFLCNYHSLSLSLALAWRIFSRLSHRNNYIAHYWAIPIFFSSLTFSQTQPDEFFSTLFFYFIFLLYYTSPFYSTFFYFFPLLFYLIFLLYFCTLFFTLFFYTLLFTLLFYLTFLPLVFCEVFHFVPNPSSSQSKNNFAQRGKFPLC